MTDPQWPDAVFAITLFCEDLAASRQFYRTVLAAEPHWGDEVSSVFRAGTTMINLLHVSAVDALIAPTAMAGPGVRAVYTLQVPSVDAIADRLQDAGLVLMNGPMDRPWGIRTISLQDPSGHVWEMSQPI